MHTLTRPPCLALSLLQLDLADLYLELAPRRFMYRLHSMVCTSGAEHQAFVLTPEHGGWLFFGDDSVTAVGAAWEDVVAKCERGSIQPLLLFYHRA
jgi:hypothetical protein